MGAVKTCDVPASYGFLRSRQSRWGGPLLITPGSVQSSRDLQQDPRRKERIRRTRETVVVNVLDVFDGHFLHVILVTPLCLAPYVGRIHSQRHAVMRRAL